MPGEALPSTAGPLRWTVALLAIASTLPYLTLKVLWLSGNRVGLNDPEFGRSAAMYAANAITFGMELVAVALAMMFVLPLGRRLPPGLVVVPMWVGTGFLAQILVAEPLQLLDGVPSESSTEEGLLADWVFTVVYAGFTGLGFFLLAGFALYANERWGRPGGWTRPLASRATGRGEKGAALLAGVDLWSVAFCSGCGLVDRSSRSWRISSATG